MPAAVAENLLRLPAVIARVGLSKTEIYRRISRGDFPAQRHIGPQTVVWPQTVIDAWVLAQIDPEAAALL